MPYKRNARVRHCLTISLRALLVVISVALVGGVAKAQSVKLAGDSVLVPSATDTLYTTNGVAISRFNSAALGSVTSVVVTGMQAGETLVDVDLRPSSAVLFGVGSTSRLYTINPISGAATQVGTAGAFTLNGTAFGMDFNPVVDRIRNVSNTEQNLRLNPNDGTLQGTDTALTPAGNVVSVAYDRSNPGITQTTLYGIDSTAGTLVMIGGINGVPSPNTGVITTVGSLGLGTNLNQAIGFDISGATGAAYASITTGGISRLYAINLTTGAATLASSNAGAIGSGTTPFVGLTSGSVPLASGVEVGGRVLSADGRGVTNAKVTIADSSGMSRTVITGRYGTFNFADVEPGHSYVISVASRRFNFAPQLLDVSDNVSGLIFTASGAGPGAR